MSLQQQLREKYKADLENFQKEKEQYYRDWVENGLVGKALTTRILTHNFAKEPNLFIKKSELISDSDRKLFEFFVKETGLAMSFSQEGDVIILTMREERN